ncbi:unnamed protein product [Ectocarpus sp. 8 AP-2014]
MKLEGDYILLPHRSPVQQAKTRSWFVHAPSLVGSFRAKEKAVAILLGADVDANLKT